MSWSRIPLLLYALSCLAIAGEARQQPAQPASGPGGNTFAHGACQRVGLFGTDARAYVLYEPRDPTPATAPVVVFLHGYLGVDPQVYGAWISHLVRRGHTVVYPIYQTDHTGMHLYAGHARQAVQDAWKRMSGEAGRVRPDPAGRWAIVGHSLGCIIGVNLAIQAADIGLPPPKALMLTTPGQGLIDLMLPPVRLPDLLLAVVVGDDDQLVGEGMGRRIFSEATGIAPANRNLIRMRSDPPLMADHLSPLAVEVAFHEPTVLLGGIPQAQGSTVALGLGTTDARDWFGYWKWCDGLLGAAFHGRDRAHALGDTPEQRFMGRWSDGVPVREPEITVGR